MDFKDLYNEYIWEREGAMLMTEEDGFITFKKLSEEELFICDMYATSTRTSRRLLDKVENLARNKYKWLSAKIDLMDPNCSNTLMVALKAGGFKLYMADSDRIKLIKRVRD